MTPPTINPEANPHRDLPCLYQSHADYCDPKTCNCQKSSEWKRKHDPFYDWLTYGPFRPPIGTEVMAFSPDWINPDYNKKGIRIGFQNEDRDGPFISAVWNNIQDCYDTDDESKPTKWKPI